LVELKVGVAPPIRHANWLELLQYQWLYVSELLGLAYVIIIIIIIIIIITMRVYATGNADYAAVD